MDQLKETNEEFLKGIANTQFAGINMRIVTREDEINFKCTQCGQCCMHRSGKDVVFLSPIDIYNGAKELGITCQEFADEYTDNWIGENSELVCFGLATTPEGMCKLLTVGTDDKGWPVHKCKIHKAKPVICAVHPFGIVHKYDSNTKTYERGYVLVDQCPQSQFGPKIKAAEIIDNIPCTVEENDLCMKIRMPRPDMKLKQINVTFIVSMMLMTAELPQDKFDELGYSDRMKKIVSKCQNDFYKEFPDVQRDPFNNEEDADELMKCIEMIMKMRQGLYLINKYLVYLNYDTNKPFKEQAEQNMKDFGEFLDVYNELYGRTLDTILGNKRKDYEEKYIEFAENFYFFKEGENAYEEES